MRSDEHLIELWLTGRNARTKQSYLDSLTAFRLFTANKSLHGIGLEDLLGFSESLAYMAPASRSVRVCVIKSLLTFGHRTGYLPHNVGAALRTSAPQYDRNRRLISEADIRKLLSAATTARNLAILQLFYRAGLTISELAALKWQDTYTRASGDGQISVTSKRRVRSIILPKIAWVCLTAIRGSAVSPDDPVFRSRHGKHMHLVSVHRVVKAAALRAGLPSEISARWLRHAHAAHALDRGAPVGLVQATLGHASAASTETYRRTRPNDSSGRYLVP